MPSTIRVEPRPVPRPRKSIVQPRARIADRHRVVFPARGGGFDSGDHLLGRERRPRGKLPRCVLSGGENLHVSSTDVDNQYAHGVQLALSRAALLEAITPIRSRQELTNDFAPSSWSWVARTSTSMPASANWANTVSESPPSAVSRPPSAPWSARAFRVPSGIVFTVNGAASALT